MSEFSKNYNKGLGLVLGGLSAIGIYSIIENAGYMLGDWAFRKIKSNAQKEENPSESKVETAD